MTIVLGKWSIAALLTLAVWIWFAVSGSRPSRVDRRRVAVGRSDG